VAGGKTEDSKNQQNNEHSVIDRDSSLGQLKYELRQRRLEAEQAKAAEPEGAPSKAQRRVSHVKGGVGRFFASKKGFVVASFFISALTALCAHWATLQYYGPPQQLTQEDIDKAVTRTLEKVTLPSQAARAAEAIAPSVVQVIGQQGDRASARDPETYENTGVGTGVVIVDKGLILTNLHVVQGAQQIKVIFHDGTESPAFIQSTQPEHDLAVLQATNLPDDLQPATLRSTNDLKAGDMVVAVGFPFGIGPSVSAGVVSGLKREFRSQEGKRMLTNLIQFDAAANPGNSGGPLVTAEGEVVGIVTGILNPSGNKVWAGIGFAVPIENAASGLGLPPF
jgi:serine protease Do